MVGGTRIYFLRHLATASNNRGHIQGRTDEPVALYEPIDFPPGFEIPRLTLLTSTLMRCRQSAGVLLGQVAVSSEGTIVDYQTLNSLVERDCGELTGRSKSSLLADHPDWFCGTSLKPGFTPPGGESIDDLLRRVRGVVPKIHAAAAHSTVVVCSHRQTLRALKCEMEGLDAMAAWSSLEFPNGKLVALGSA